MSKLVWGAGFNDKTRPVSVDGKKVKEYKPYRKERPADRFSGLDRHSAFEENGCTGF